MLFLDESGDLGLNGTNYFVISILEIEKTEYKKLKNILKRLQKYKFKKQLKKENEIKGSKTNKKIKIHILKKMKTIDYKTYSIIMNKMETRHRKDLKNRNINEVYIEMVCELLSEKHICSDYEIMIFDKFVPYYDQKMFKRKLFEILDNTKASLKFLESFNSLGIQYVDVISWSIFQSFENNSTEFIDIFKEKTEYKNKKNLHPRGILLI